MPYPDHHNPIRVVILGGSGTQAWRYLARIDDFDVTVIAPATDSGGNTGFINMFEESNVLVSGDLGKVAAAFLSGAHGTNSARSFLTHRLQFAPLKGYTMGNIAQIAAHEIAGTQTEALALLSDIFPFNARLLLASESMPILCARYASGGTVKYEHAIDNSSHAESGAIADLWTEPEDIRATRAVVEAIESADYIVLGPGDLFTSKGATIVVPGVREAIRAAREKNHTRVIDVVNLMTKVGHTAGFTAREHVDVIMDLFEVPVDAIFVNNGTIRPEDIARYESVGAEQVRHTVGERYRDLPVFADDLVDANPQTPAEGDTVSRSYLRHDPIALHALFLQYHRRCMRERIEE